MPVQAWAVLGAAFTIFWAYVLIKWVTGPYFTPVDSGPDDPPTYMKVALVTWQAAAIPLVAFFIYWFLIRPWRRERVVNTTGLMVIAALPMALQDPVSDYFGYWYTYNTWMWNVGSFVNEIPGWQAFGAPGAQAGYPILFHLLAYPGTVLLGIAIGKWVMDRASARWNLAPQWLILTCFGALLVFDFFLEGMFWMPLGFYSFPGAHLSLFPDAYNRLPWHELVTGSAFFTAPAVLWYFRNDKGETLVERGVSELRVSTGRKTALRLLALIAAFQVTYLVTYNLPNAGWIGADPAVWPDDIQQRSYFTDNLCGPRTDRVCPGDGVPLTTSMWVDQDGVFHGPSAERLQPVPLNPDPPGPWSGGPTGSK